MIPKEIALQLDQLKEKVKTYSSIQRSLHVYDRREKVDEIKAAVKNANDAIADLAWKTDNILVDGLITNFGIEGWFEGLKDKSDFPEANPRLIYEEKRQDLEKRKKIAEENASKEYERNLKELKANRLKEYQFICFNGPDDYEAIYRLMKRGLNMSEDGRIYNISTLIRMGRSPKFINFLIESGMKVNEDEKDEIERLRQKQNDLGSQLSEERSRREIGEEEWTVIQKKLVNEFRNICYYGPDDINKVQKLIDLGLDIAPITYNLSTLIDVGRSQPFIKYLIIAGMKINVEDVLYCINSKSIFNSEEFLKVLISAKNIDKEAFEMAKAVLMQKAEDNINKLKK